MGFFGNLIGKAAGGLIGGLFGDKGRSVGSDIGGVAGSNFIPFAGGGRIVLNPSRMTLGSVPMRKGGKIRVLGSMPMVSVQRKLRRGSAEMKRKMAKLRSMKK
jgi:hypothetical protein